MIIVLSKILNPMNTKDPSIVEDSITLNLQFFRNFSIYRISKTQRAEAFCINWLKQWTLATDFSNGL